MQFWAKKWKCAFCGELIRRDANFCDKCGVARREYKDRYDFFVSYRRDGGADVATIIQLALGKIDKNVFLDVTDLGAGRFEDRILNVISESDTFIVILSAGCLDRCVNPDDWFGREVLRAIEKNKRIIPICMPDFSFPDKDFFSGLPNALSNLPTLQAVEWNASNVDAAIRKIVKYATTPYAGSNVKTEPMPRLPVENLKQSSGKISEGIGTENCSIENVRTASFSIMKKKKILFTADEQGVVRKWSMQTHQLLGEKKFPRPVNLIADPFEQLNRISLKLHHNVDILFLEDQSELINGKVGHDTLKDTFKDRRSNHSTAANASCA